MGRGGDAAGPDPGSRPVWNGAGAVGPDLQAMGQPTMTRRWLVMAMAVMAVVLSAIPARADLVFENGLVNSFSGSEAGLVLVRDNPAPPPLVTTLYFQPGASSGDDLRAYGASQLIILGGSIGDDLYGYDDSRITMHAGTIADDIRALGRSRIELWGGTVTDTVAAREDATLVIHGYGFNYAYGDVADLVGTITGFLKDGTAFNSAFDRSLTGTIRLEAVPEPATLTLVGLGGLLLAGRQLRRRQRARTA